MLLTTTRKTIRLPTGSAIVSLINNKLGYDATADNIPIVDVQPFDELKDLHVAASAKRKAKRKSESVAVSAEQQPECEESVESSGEENNYDLSRLSCNSLDSIALSASASEDDGDTAAAQTDDVNDNATGSEIKNEGEKGEAEAADVN